MNGDQIADAFPERSFLGSGSSAMSEIATRLPKAAVPLSSRCRGSDVKCVKTQSQSRLCGNQVISDGSLLNVAKRRRLSSSATIVRFTSLQIPRFPSKFAIREIRFGNRFWESETRLWPSARLAVPLPPPHVPFWEHRSSDRLGKPTPALCLVRCQRAAILPSSLRRW